LTVSPDNAESVNQLTKYLIPLLQAIAGTSPCL